MTVDTRYCNTGVMNSVSGGALYGRVIYVQILNKCLELNDVFQNYLFR